MSHKLSGDVNVPGTIIIVNQDTWTLDATQTITVGSSTWQVDGLDFTRKMVVFRADTDISTGTERGEARGFADVFPERVDNIGSANRGVSAGGNSTQWNYDTESWDNSSAVNVIDYFDITTNGDAQDFGDLTEAGNMTGNGSSNGTNNRGVFRNAFGRIDYVTISTPGNASDFGNGTTGAGSSSLDNGTGQRAVYAGGYSSGFPHDTMEYITISTPSSTSDFGDLSYNCWRFGSGTSNDTNNRGVFGGGQSRESGGHFGLDTLRSDLAYITITSLGNATTFGDLQAPTYIHCSTSNGANNTAVFMGGQEYGLPSNNPAVYLQKINISTLGDAVTYGMTDGSLGPLATLLKDMGRDSALSLSYADATSNKTGNKGVMGRATLHHFNIASGGMSYYFGDLVDFRHPEGVDISVYGNTTIKGERVRLGMTSNS